MRNKKISREGGKMKEKSVLKEIDELRKIVLNAKRVPFSKYVSIDRTEILSKINTIEQLIPDEMKSAFFVDKKKEEILQDAFRKRDEILQKAKEEKERLVSQSEITKQANAERERILKEARKEANGIIKDAENYAIRVLEQANGVLEKAKVIIQKGKDSLTYEDSDSEDQE